MVFEPVDEVDRCEQEDRTEEIVDRSERSEDIEEMDCRLD